MKKIQNKINYILVEASKKPFKTITLPTGVSIEHYRNGTLNVIQL